jgi:hypothetical protein
MTMRCEMDSLVLVTYGSFSVLSPVSSPIGQGCYADSLDGKSAQILKKHSVTVARSAVYRGTNELSQKTF